ncbi:predicted protein [Naegleria gruberi]|uniref:ADP/ATP translocase n=1 Tax=Naegleria gruberi TaxID=5762 RepID=D2W018_NAEGR|nr:uncharacterized protein NAEGRDRAFT_74698 [Naegleria gruberi]EFC37670.1 predicted protein [Naegleria gruberi]|eukprot:XP_002670414.1 predicted protein [Naegleria gruberi strain NEG-M]
MSTTFTLSASAILSEQLIGLVSPISRAIISSPFNRIRIILQTQNDIKTTTNTTKQSLSDPSSLKSSSSNNTNNTNNNNTSNSSNVIDCGIKIIKQEGILSLWKGFSAQLASVLLVHYSTIPVSRFVFTNISNSPLLASIINSIISYPLEQCKTILLVDEHVHHLNYGGANNNNNKNKNDGNNNIHNNEKQYSGVIDYFIKRSNESGLVSHYHGFITYILGGLIYRKSFSLIYQILRNIRPSLYFDNMSQWSIVISEIILAQLCIASASALAYPLDTISRRLQLQACKKSEDRKFTNTIQCAKKIIREEGVLALYQGYEAHCLSAFSLTLMSLVLHSVFGIH